jgi:hypothetical protein
VLGWRRSTAFSPSPSSSTIAIVSEFTFTPDPTLAKVHIFSGLTESELGFLAQRAVQRHCSAGESVFGEGEACSGLYVVESGPAIGARPGAGVTVASFVSHLPLGPARELAEDLHSRGLQRVCAIRSGSVERTTISH